MCRTVEANDKQLTREISVIIPVYNVEKFFPFCINSVFNQTFADYEIILIDDGSTDSSGKMCDEYAKKDDRVRVYHIENGGQSRARNFGIDCSCGKYITFLDSDDFIHSDFLSELYSLIKEYDCDVVMSDRVLTDKQEIQNIDSETEIISYSPEQAINGIYYDAMFIAVWGKLYKRKVFDNIKFEENLIYEDEYIMPQIYHSMDKMIFKNKVLYYYLQRCGSTMTIENPLKKLNFITIIEKRMDFYRKNAYNEFYLIDESKYCASLINVYNLFTALDGNKEKYQKEIKEKLIKNRKKFLKNNHLNVKYKLLLHLMKFNFNIIKIAYR